MTINQLIDQLLTDGGAIVACWNCSEMEIANEQANGRFAVREDGIGFVLRPQQWLEYMRASLFTYDDMRQKLDSALEGEAVLKRERDEARSERDALKVTLLMLRNAALKHKMDKDDLEIEDANAALAAVSESHEHDYDMKALADRIDEHISQSESQREADVLRDEMAAHADYLERAQAGETSDDDCELYGHGEESESNWEAAAKADEKPDGQAENADGLGRRTLDADSK